MTRLRRGARLLAVAAGVLALALAAAAPAAAHAGDPTLVNRLSEVGPGLPEGVTAELVTTVADQIVVSNPTPVPLLVLDDAGAAFLRISAAGVEGNLAAPYYHRSVAPEESRAPVPASAADGAPPRWVSLSDATTWAWFDPRLAPGFQQVPVGGRQDVTDVEELATWTVPLRYGDTAVAMEGALVRRPVEGRFETVLGPVPEGVSAIVGQGYVPSLSLQAGTGREVTVLGRDGQPYLRFGPGLAEMNRDSATYRDGLLARGGLPGPADTGWQQLPGTTTTWLDTRLRFPAEDPPADVVDAEAPVEVLRWEIPLIVDGAPQALTGTVRWLPNPPRIGEGSPWVTGGIVAGVVVLLAGGVALVLRNRRLGELEQPDEEVRDRVPTP
ncbi:MAG TPA: hypothetical protein VM367_14965 [Pseudonocardia sp.]|jgi:hypothetical protein|nr:hypothetical protein [Pseudonocardia sp.]